MEPEDSLPYSHKPSTGPDSGQIIPVHTKNSELLGFRAVSIGRYSKNQKRQRFGNWICFRPQGRQLLRWVP
jgi:hypothetical protein